MKQLRRRTGFLLAVSTLLTFLLVVPLVGAQNNPPAQPAEAGGETGVGEFDPNAISLPLPERKERYVYKTYGRRDPFKPLIEGTEMLGANRPPGIEGMAISEIALKGILDLPGGFAAVFEGSDGKAYRLQEGDVVFDGRVVKVSENQVIFEKIILDPFGREKEKKLIEVKLHM
jgi:Tfp pilus assembly protein PilP